jgi:putative MATE family efflux protein
MAVPLNGGLVMVAGLAVPLSLGLFVATPSLFPLLTGDAEVVGAGVPYLQARLVGMLAIGCNFAFRGYWNGVSMSRLYLRTLVVMHVSNVALSYVLIFGPLGLPEYGATGAGLGTMISTYIGTAYYFLLGRRHASDAGFLSAFPSRKTLAKIMRVSVPSGVQQFFYAFGLTMLFRIVAAIGTSELAAANVILNVSMVAFLPGLGLGLSAASLVGQALGRRDVDDAERWGWDVVKVGSLIMVALSLPMLVLPEQILMAFFPDDPEPVAVAIAPLRIAGASMAIEAIGIILINSITGAGATKLSMTISIGLQWLVFLPAAYLVGPVMGFGLLGVWLANVGFRMLLAAVSAVCWRRRVWAGVAV